MMKKHAYLMMVHHRKDLLDLLLEELDDERNDIYLHIDKRATEFSFSDFHLKHAGLYPVESMAVSWGGSSQVECELRLLEEAHHHGPYSYYHLMQGSSFPLKNQDELHDFYDSRQGTQFMSIDEDDEEFEERVRYKYFFMNVANPTLKEIIEKSIIMYILVEIQKRLGLDFFKKYNMKYKKGNAYWSITEEFCEYLLENQNKIRKMLKYSVCGDETMVQIFAYNSSFRDQISFYNENEATSYWFLTWSLEALGLDRYDKNFQYEDLNAILNSGCNFARKFEGDDGIRLIEEIKKKIHPNQ